MTTKTAKLFNPALLSTSAKLLYQSPPLTKTIVRKIGFYNVSSQVVEVCLYIAPKDEVESNANLILKRKLASSESFEFLGAVNDVLESGDTIRASASISDAVNVRGSGSQIVES